MNQLRIGAEMALSLLCATLPSVAADVPPTGTGLLRGIVVDQRTGLPTPCTITLIGSDGKTAGELEAYRGGFRCDGQFSQRLPAGPARVRVTRGFETRASERVVDVPAGGAAEVRLALERVVDLRARGWYAGDSHAHMLHGEKTLPVEFDDVARAARAEDLQYFSLAQAWTLENPTPERLEAELRARSQPDCVLTWNLEAPKNYYRGDAGRCLGHCWTLAVSGRTTEGNDVIATLLQASAHDYETNKPSFANFESHALIRAQGGRAFYSHPARWWMGAWGGQAGYPKQERMRVSNLAVELPLDTLLGPTFDGLDVITGSGEYQANAMAFELWCLLLNHGYRVAATASSDSCFDRVGGATPGAARTYTYLNGGFSLSKVAQATAQGRTFVTTGPLLLASIGGQPPGSAFPANGLARALQIEAWASGADAKGLTRLEILKNGQPVQTNYFAPPVASVATNYTIRETANAWYCVRVFGGDAQRQRASSGAFFFETRDYRPPPPTPARVRVILADAASGRQLNGTVTEVAFLGTLPRAGKQHAITGGAGELTVPGSVRLRAEAAGYRPLTLSPFLHHPPLMEFITGLSAEDLLKWETFEHLRVLLGDISLKFQLEKK